MEVINNKSVSAVEEWLNVLENSDTSNLSAFACIVLGSSTQGGYLIDLIDGQLPMYTFLNAMEHKNNDSGILPTTAQQVKVPASI